MKNYHTRILIWILSIFLPFISCRKWIEVSPPSGQLVNTSVFESDPTATAAQLNIYTGQMQQESWNMSKNCGLLSDELDGSYSSDLPSVTEFYTNAMSNIIGPGPWTNAYNYIYQANAIIEGLAASKGTSLAVRKQLTGESKFVRAFWHFYLTNCYGDVPLITSTDFKLNASKERSPVQEVYKQVQNDLEDAVALLNSNYVNATDTAATPDRIRPNQWTAKALLARLFLYTNHYDSAAYYATEVIKNSSLYQLTDSLDEVFLANSTEAIWQLGVPVPNYYNTIDGYYFILKSQPISYAAQNGVTISSQLLKSFEPNDQRKRHWIGTYITDDGSNDTFYFPNKYKVYQSSDITEYCMMLRLAEQFLIRAESRVQANDFLGAMEDLNKIRRRAGLADYGGAIDKQSLMATILKERRAELLCEWGHRWFDLIRTANINAVMSVSTPLKGGGAWNPNDALFPIPQSERNKDPHLTQNKGY